MSAECEIPPEWEDFGVGPLLGIDYLRAYHCSFEDTPAFFTCGMLVLVVFLIWMLGNTAGNYLSPSLAKVCERLNLSYNVAGVTFLAFGNGAPDVFSSVSAFSGSENAPLIGINGMLGSAMFVATVVVGTISIMSPCYVSSKIFIRDVCFFIVAAIAVNIMALVQNITTAGAASLFLIYLTYVIVVLVVSTLDAQKASNEGLSIPTSRMGDQDVRLEHDFKVIQTAFWHKNEPDAGTGGTGAAAAKDTDKADSTVGSPSSNKDDNNKAEAYTFLILDDTSDDENDQGPKRDLDSSYGEDEESASTINLSGGLISAAFDGDVIDDYVGEKLRSLGGVNGASTPTTVRYDSHSGTDDVLASKNAQSLKASPSNTHNKGSKGEGTWGVLQTLQSTKSPLTDGTCAYVFMLC